MTTKDHKRNPSSPSNPHHDIIVPMNSPKLVPELIVSHLDRSLTFYRDILGFTVLFERLEEKFAYLEREGAELMIEQPMDRTFLAGELTYPYGRGINLQIETKEVDRLYERIQSTNSKIYLPIEEKWYRRNKVMLGHRQFIVQDPDGYLLRFFQAIGSKSYSKTMIKQD